MNIFKSVFYKIIKNRHYTIDQNGIMNRYLTEKKNWQEHLNNSKQYILDCISNKNYNTLAILGSGWLLDVPVDDILKQGVKLYLLDINHPKQIVNKYKNEKNITFIKTDLTNNLTEKINYAKDINDFINIVNNNSIIYFNKYDFVVSLNLLNQLDILLCDLLKKKFTVNNNDLINIRQTIQQNHLTGLSKGKGCIITDYNEINYKKQINEGVSKQLIYVSLDNLKNKKEWIWNFDTKETYNSNLKTVFKVISGEV